MKSNNPLKMWGSYIVPILAIIGYFSQAFTLGVFCPKLNFVVTELGDIFCSSTVTPKIMFFGFWLNPILWYTLVIILGFLVGWGIHSLIRRLK